MAERLDAVRREKASPGEARWQETLKTMIAAIVSKMVVIEKDQPSELPFVFRNHGGISFAHGPDALELIDRARSHVLKQKRWDGRISEDFATDRLMRLVQRLLADKDTSRLDEYLPEFLDGFVKAIENQTVFVPVFGISMTIESWRIGRAQLVNVTEGLLERWCSGMNEVTSAMFQQGVRPGVYVMCEVEAEADRAKELAFDETLRVIDLLRFSVSLRQECARGRIVIAPEEEINLQPENRQICIIPRGFRTIEVHWRATHLDHVDWEITPDLIKALDQLGFDRLLSVLSKPYADVSEFEKAVIRAVHWFSNYQFQFESENKLLSLITALESLLTPKDGNPIGTAIAEAVAIICSDELAARKRIKARFKDLYRNRSAVSHGGHKSVMDSDLVMKAGQLVMKAGQS